MFQGQLISGHRVHYKGSRERERERERERSRIIGGKVIVEAMRGGKM